MCVKSLGVLMACTGLYLSAGLARFAEAQCCGGATTAYYAPAAYTAYSPVAYQTYSSGWYPGYFLDRIRARLWGSPSTYVAAYPSTYYASYPTYTASYAAPAYTASYASPAYTASYSAVTSYASPCTTCGVQQVTMRPVCETCTTCDPCLGCPVSGTYDVGQASYTQAGGCATCGTGQVQQSAPGGTTIVVPNGTVVTPGSQQPSDSGAQPTIDPQEQVSPERTFQQRPIDANETGRDITPEPGLDNGRDELDDVLNGNQDENSTYFEAPKLFNPKDRTAQRHIAPARTALYEKPIHAQRTAAIRRNVTAQQAAHDAAGWISASN